MAYSVLWHSTRSMVSDLYGCLGRIRTIPDSHSLTIIGLVQSARRASSNLLVRFQTPQLVWLCGAIFSYR